MDDELYFAEACEIDTRLFGNDYDIISQQDIDREIEEANRGDNDEEAERLYGMI